MIWGSHLDGMGFGAAIEDVLGGQMKGIRGLEPVEEHHSRPQPYSVKTRFQQ